MMGESSIQPGDALIIPGVAMIPVWFTIRFISWYSQGIFMVLSIAERLQEGHEV